MMTETTYVPATSENKPEFDKLDLSSGAFWNQTSEERERTYAELREFRPVSWHRPMKDTVTPDPNDPGFWAVVSHRDIVTVSRDHETFSSRQGVLFDLLPEMFLEMAQSFLAMDPPKHDKLRRLVSAAFTPKQIARIEHKIVEAAHAVVSDIAGRGEIEFVAECSSVLPLRVFSEIFGIPEELRSKVGTAAAGMVAWADDEYLAGRAADQVQMEAATGLHEVAAAMIQERRERPTDDLMTSLVYAEVDGARLDDLEIAAFFVLMAVAGTDTTKNTATNTVLAMTEFPEQRQWLMDDFDGRIGIAIEEFVRFATPAMNFRRTAMTDTELGGQKITRGDKVVMFFQSGNWDTEVFDDPDLFDLSRDPNPHLGFGGGGVHYCLGNQLAKSMLRALFRELLTQIPDFRACDPEYLGTNFIRGIKRMTLRFEPAVGGGK